MNPINAVLVGIVLALAIKRRNEYDHLGACRWVAGGLAALFPYSEVFLYFVGPGALAQGMRGLTWSLLLMPIYAVGLAGVIGVCARRSWEDVFAPVVGGLAASWVLALLTEEGLFPLALLVDWRVGLGVLNPFDVVIVGLCVVGLAMAYFFKVFDRDLARLTLLCVAGYVGMAGWWSWQAREFGHAYARVQEIPHATVKVVPQALSPLNWRVLVAEPNGRLHDTRITLGRPVGGHVAESDDPYRAREAAVWRVYRRYGDLDVPEETQRQVRLAWYGWQKTPFAWLGRFAIYERMYAPQEVGINMACVGFRDIRAMTEREKAQMTYVVCPGRGRTRVFQPAGVMDKKGNWPGMNELVGFIDARG